VLVGGKGFDVVSFVRSATGIKANLLVGRSTGQGLDQLATVESIDGSQQRDHLLGDEHTNFLFGGSGVDSISGLSAADFLEGGARASSLKGGAGEDYCLNGAGASRCEISGSPQIPSISDKPPAARVLSGESAVNRLPGIVMTAPPGLRSGLRALTRFRTSALGVFGDRDSEVASRSRGWSFASPLLRLFESAATAGPRSFRYSGQPSCFAERKPYRTTIAPPEQVEPAIADGAREQVFWRGLLFRHGRGGKLVRFRATPWLTAVVQGAPVPTGFPVWTDTTQTSFAGSQSFTVPGGTYTWAGVITWVRTGQRIQKHIAPHLVHAGATKPDRSCTFR
jgi:hemolysin type calcium-binding protein